MVTLCITLAVILILHGKFHLFDIKVEKYYIYYNQLQVIPTPFERASNFGFEMTFAYRGRG
jgi:hypothetical protein